MPVFARYGLVGGVVLGTLFFFPFAIFGLDDDWLRISEVVGYSTMVLCMTSTFLAMRSEKAHRGGTLRFGSAFGIGVGVTLIASLLFGLFTWLFYFVQGEGAGQVMIDHYTQQLLQSGLPSAEIDAQLAEIESMKGWILDARFQAALMFATVFLIGTVESGFGALFLTVTSATRKTATAS